MRLKRILIITILTILFCAIYSLAAEPQITIEGENIAKPNETKILTIKISSETEVGVVSGKIEANNSITNINVTGKNNWNLTFNKETGVFNIYKAEGSKTEEIISIEYTTASTEGIGKITISNIKMTTIEYETKEVQDIVQDITIKEDNQNLDPKPTVVTLTGIKVTTAPTKTLYTEGEKFDKTGMIVKAEYSNGTNKEITSYTYTPREELNTTDKKITISYTEEGITKTIEQEIGVISVAEDNKENMEDNSLTPDKVLPQTGEEKIIKIMLMVTIILSVILYFGYTKYKNI